MEEAARTNPLAKARQLRLGGFHFQHVFANQMRG